MPFGDDSNEVKVYCTERMIDGARYAEEICARSWAEAEELASRIDATVCGVLQTTVCAACGEEILNDPDGPFADKPVVVH